jgi:hypothetical protein
MIRTSHDARGRLDQLRSLGMRFTRWCKLGEGSYWLGTRTQAHRKDGESAHLKNDRDDIAGKWNLHYVSWYNHNDSFLTYVCWR